MSLDIVIELNKSVFHVERFKYLPEYAFDKIPQFFRSIDLKLNNKPLLGLIIKSEKNPVLRYKLKTYFQNLSYYRFQNLNETILVQDLNPLILAAENTPVRNRFTAKSASVATSPIFNYIKYDVPNFWSKFRYITNIVILDSYKNDLEYILNKCNIYLPNELLKKEYFETKELEKDSFKLLNRSFYFGANNEEIWLPYNVSASVINNMFPFIKFDSSNLREIPSKIKIYEFDLINSDFDKSDFKLIEKSENDFYLSELIPKFANVDKYIYQIDLTKMIAKKNLKWVKEDLFIQVTLNNIKNLKYVDRMKINIENIGITEFDSIFIPSKEEFSTKIIPVPSQPISKLIITTQPPQTSPTFATIINPNFTSPNISSILSSIPIITVDPNPIPSTEKTLSSAPIPILPSGETLTVTGPKSEIEHALGLKLSSNNLDGNLEPEIYKVYTVKGEIKMTFTQLKPLLEMGLDLDSVILPKISILDWKPNTFHFLQHNLYWKKLDQLKYIMMTKPPQIKIIKYETFSNATTLPTKSELVIDIPSTKIPSYCIPKQFLTNFKNIINDSNDYYIIVPLELSEIDINNIYEIDSLFQTEIPLPSDLTIQFVFEKSIFTDHLELVSKRRFYEINSFDKFAKQDYENSTAVIQLDDEQLYSFDENLTLFKGYHLFTWKTENDLGHYILLPTQNSKELQKILEACKQFSINTIIDSSLGITEYVPPPPPEEDEDVPPPPPPDEEPPPPPPPEEEDVPPPPPGEEDVPALPESVIIESKSESGATSVIVPIKKIEKKDDFKFILIKPFVSKTPLYFGSNKNNLIINDEIKLSDVYKFKNQDSKLYDSLYNEAIENFNTLGELSKQIFVLGNEDLDFDSETDKNRLTKLIKNIEASIYQLPKKLIGLHEVIINSSSIFKDILVIQKNVFYNPEIYLYLVLEWIPNLFLQIIPFFSMGFYANELTDKFPWLWKIDSKTGYEEFLTQQYSAEAMDYIFDETRKLIEQDKLSKKETKSDSNSKVMKFIYRYFKDKLKPIEQLPLYRLFLGGYFEDVKKIFRENFKGYANKLRDLINGLITDLTNSFKDSGYKELTKEEKLKLIKPKFANFESVTLRSFLQESPKTYFNNSSPSPKFYPFIYSYLQKNQSVKYNSLWKEIVTSFIGEQKSPDAMLYATSIAKLIASNQINDEKDYINNLKSKRQLEIPKFQVGESKEQKTEKKLQGEIKQDYEIIFSMLRHNYLKDASGSNTSFIDPVSRASAFVRNNQPYFNEKTDLYYLKFLKWLAFSELFRFDTFATTNPFINRLYLEISDLFFPSQISQDADSYWIEFKKRNTEPPEKTIMLNPEKTPDGTLFSCPTAPNWNFNPKLETSNDIPKNSSLKYGQKWPIVVKATVKGIPDPQLDGKIIALVDKLFINCNTVTNVFGNRNQTFNLDQKHPIWFDFIRSNSDPNFIKTIESEFKTLVTTELKFTKDENSFISDFSYNTKLIKKWYEDRAKLSMSGSGKIKETADELFSRYKESNSLENYFEYANFLYVINIHGAYFALLENDMDLQKIVPIVYNKLS